MADGALRGFVPQLLKGEGYLHPSKTMLPPSAQSMLLVRSIQPSPSDSNTSRSYFNTVVGMHRRICM